MLPLERREAIRRLLNEKRTLKISELSAMFGVSEMTIHRDINRLVEEGIAVKTFGGVTLAKPEPATRRTASYPASAPTGHMEKPEPIHAFSAARRTTVYETCVYCGKFVDPLLAYRIVRHDDTVETACCPHCGLLYHRNIQHHAAYALTQDHLTRTTVPAESSVYVIGAEAPASCCRPAVVAIGDPAVAERFVRGFGGTVLSWREAIKTLHATMSR